MLNKHTSDLIFIKWLLFFISLIIILLSAEQYNLLSSMLKNDVSYISSIILCIFFFSTIKVGFELYYLKDRYLNIMLLSANLSSNLKVNALENFNYFKKSTIIDNIIIVKYISSVISLTRSNKSIEDMKNSFENDITAKLETGWFIADLLLKLGLIGTVVGFIIMLSAITEIENFDLTLMNALLQSMSGGMKVALYTTLTGLVTSILLSMQYKYLESLVYKIFHTCNSLIPYIDEELGDDLKNETTIL
tara:strand:- start:492 stop:1235 length:744 start_codon:yes stop_codon:yes gene_type:complete